MIWPLPRNQDVRIDSHVRDLPPNKSGTRKNLYGNLYGLGASDMLPRMQGPECG